MPTRSLRTGWAAVVRFETRLGTPLSVRVLWPAHAMPQDARQRKPIASKLEPR